MRGRLIAGLVALLAVACATVGLVTYIAAQNALSGELNNELQTATGLGYNCWEHQYHGSGNDEGGQSGASTTPFSVAESSCPGLGENTFVARDFHDQWQSTLIGDGKFKLTAADEASLDTIPSWSARPHGGPGSGPDAPTHTRYLTGTRGTYLLTAVNDPDGDGSVYITGLPLAIEHDQLGDIALAEAVVFGAVLLLAGVLGMLWVRFSLRPLRRVATTASQVAELPLESRCCLAARRGARHRPAHRDRPGRARVQPHARSRGDRAAAPGGEREPAAPVRRRRQPRAAHAARRDPRLRRARPAPPGRLDPTRSPTHSGGYCPSPPG